MNISFIDAVFGKKLEVPTIDGKVMITIKPGTQSGTILRLKNKGIPSDHGTGEQLIYVQIWTPTKLTKEETKALEDLSKSDNFDPKSSKSKTKSFFDNIKSMF